MKDKQQRFWARTRPGEGRALWFFSTLALAALLSACAAQTGAPNGGASGGGTSIAASALMPAESDEIDGVIFALLEGHVDCPDVAYYDDGAVYDDDDERLGDAVRVEVREGRAARSEESARASALRGHHRDAGAGDDAGEADAGAALDAGAPVDAGEADADVDGGGARASNGLSDDAFFDNVEAGPYTVCAWLADEGGAAIPECRAGRATVDALENRKTHATVIVSCDTDGTQDVGAVAIIEHEPQIDVTSAFETGLVACGDDTTADVLTASAVIHSPDGTDAEYRLDFVGDVPDGISLNPSAGTWLDATGGIEFSLANESGLPAIVTVRLGARTPSLGVEDYLFAEEYELTFEWLECI